MPFGTWCEILIFKNVIWWSKQSIFRAFLKEATNCQLAKIQWNVFLGPHGYSYIWFKAPDFLMIFLLKYDKGEKNLMFIYRSKMTYESILDLAFAQTYLDSFKPFIENRLGRWNYCVNPHQKNFKLKWISLNEDNCFTMCMPVHYFSTKFDTFSNKKTRNFLEFFFP